MWTLHHIWQARDCKGTVPSAVSSSFTCSRAKFCISSGTSSKRTFKTNSLIFLFYLKSVNLLLSSVFRPSTAEAHFAASVAKHSDNLRSVSSRLIVAEVPTHEVYYQKIWCDQTDFELSYICLAFLGGGTKTLGGSHAARGPQVKPLT